MFNLLEENPTNMMTQMDAEYWRELQALSKQIIPLKVDVAFTSGGKTHINHPGNLVFDNLIKRFQGRYNGCDTTSLVRQTIVKSIVKAILENGGRFLESSVDNMLGIEIWHDLSSSKNKLGFGTWQELTISKAIYRTASLLSDSGNANAKEQRIMIMAEHLQRHQNTLIKRAAATPMPGILPSDVLSIGSSPLLGSSTHSNHQAVGNAFMATELDEERVMREKQKMERIILLRKQQQDEQKVASLLEEKRIEQKYIQLELQLQQRKRKRKEEQISRQQQSPVVGMIQEGEQQQLKHEAQPVKLKKITDSDVIVIVACSVDWNANKGNIELKKLLWANLKVFNSSAESIKDTSITIVATIRQRKGRFLKKLPFGMKDSKLLDGCWYDVGNTEAVAWTANLLETMYSMEEKCTKRKIGTLFEFPDDSSKGDSHLVVPNAGDVLLVKRLSHHPGNVFFRKCVLVSTQDESLLDWDTTKLMEVSRSIVTAARVRHNSRFLERAEPDVCQNEITWKQASFYNAATYALCALNEVRENHLNRVADELQKRKDSGDVATVEIMIESPGDTDLVCGAGSKRVANQEQERKGYHEQNDVCGTASKCIADEEQERKGYHKQNASVDDVTVEIAIESPGGTNVVFGAGSKRVTDDEQEREARHKQNVATVEPAIESPSETDVVFGAGFGKEALKHPGNQVYRSLIACNTGRYLKCDSEVKKGRVCQSIVAAIKGQDGRFLRKNQSSGLWEIILDNAVIVVTHVILRRVAKNNGNGETKEERNLKVEQLQGKKKTHIDMTDEDDGNDDPEKIDDVSLESSSLDVQETLIGEDRRRMRKGKEQLKKECVALMAQTLHDLQEKKLLVNVTPAEYQTIEKLAKEKTGLSKHCYLSKKLVLKLASTLRKNEMKKKNTTTMPVLEAVCLSTQNPLLLSLSQVIKEEDLDDNNDCNVSESNDCSESKSSGNDGYNSDQSLVF